MMCGDYMGIFNKLNWIYGALTAFLAAVFGKYWFLFAGFLIFNVVDWLTGWYASYLNHEESSRTGLKGILKKVAYWIVIGISFYIGNSFENMGNLMGIQLSFMNFVGWFVLASFLVNELRSVLENIVKINADAVPEFLIRGLKVTDELINERVGESNEEDRTGRS